MIAPALGWLESEGLELKDRRLEEGCSPRAGVAGGGGEPPALGCGAERLFDCCDGALQTALGGTAEPQGLQAPIRAAAGRHAAAGLAEARRGCAHPGDPRILGGAQAADNDHTKRTTAGPSGLAASCRASIGCPTVGKGSHEERGAGRASAWGC